AQSGADAAGSAAGSPDPTTDAAADGGPFPPLLIVTAAPADPGPARRLAVLLTHTTGRLGIRGVLLGTWPLGTTWQVNPDGTIQPGTIHPSTIGPDGRRRPGASEPV